MLSSDQTGPHCLASFDSFMTLLTLISDHLWTTFTHSQQTFSLKFQSCVLYCRPTLIIDNKYYINAIKLHINMLIWDGIWAYVTICWTSDDCDGQVDLKLHLSVGQVIYFPISTTVACTHTGHTHTVCVSV